MSRKVLNASFQGACIGFMSGVLFALGSISRSPILAFLPVAVLALSILLIVAEDS